MDPNVNKTEGILYRGRKILRFEQSENNKKHIDID